MSDASCFHNLREGGIISEHDYHLGQTVAEILCGGDVDAGSLVDEAWILALERKARIENGTMFSANRDEMSAV